MADVARGKTNPNIKAGGTMWTIRGWRGSVYPEQDPQRTWPGHYGRQFGTLEFNATHYRIHPADRMAEWAAAMPDGFTFCPKFPQIVTHFRRFNGCDGPTDDFIDGLLALGDKLGPAFIQPPHFAPKHADAMATYLEQWPRELRVAVEFRHPEWFEGARKPKRCGHDSETWAWGRSSATRLGAETPFTCG